MRQIDPMQRLARLERESGTRRALALRLGLSPSTLSQIMNGRRDINDALLAKLGLRRVVVEVRP